MAGGLEDSVLQGLKMLQKNAGVSKKQSGELFLPGNPRQGVPANFLFFLNSLYAPTIDKEPIIITLKYIGETDER